MENEEMAARLPRQWWDIVLDGNPYRVDLSATPYKNLAVLRAAVYREADTRLTNVVTHKIAVSCLLVQAWGTGGREPIAPQLDSVTPAQAAPAIEAASRTASLRARECNCGAGPDAHLLTCIAWGDKRMLYPTHQEQPPTMTVEPQLSAADIQALLGPCTCGQSPTCAPTCDRFK